MALQPNTACWRNRGFKRIDMKSSRIWLIVVVVLLLLNTAALALLWFKRPAPPKGNAKEFLVRELSLTAEQQEQFDDLRASHQQKIRSVMEGVRPLKDAMVDKITAAVADTAGIDSLTHAVAEKERQRDLATIEHFRQFRSILDQRQQRKFDNILKQVLRMMAGPQRPGGPPPHHGGPPPDSAQPFPEP